jgi:hypothetical protein
MRCLRAILLCTAVLWFGLAASVARAQAPAPQNQLAQAGQDTAPASPEDERKRPLTPEEEREKQIRQFDPVAQPDDAQATDTGGQGKNDNARQPQPQDQTPLPNSIAASEQNAEVRGPRVIEDEDAQPAQEYNGPAVLSRSYSLNQPLIPQQLKWTESIGLNFFYDSGLVAASTDQTGSINDTAAFGNQITWTITGRHYWKKDVLGVSFIGNAATATQNSVAAGSNMALTLDYTHTLTRRLSLHGTFSGSKLSQNYSLENPAVSPDTTIANINLASSPQVQIFDSGLKQVNATFALQWQESARLSFSASGSYFAIDQDSTALLGMTGEQGSGDMNYRITRKTTIGSYYSYSYYLYPHGTGQSTTNTVGGIYSYALNRSTQVRLRGGVSHSVSLGLETVQILNPLIAALLGQTAGIIDAYNATTGSDISAQIVHDFRGRRTANIAYAKGITPGNGVFLTSEMESLTAGYSATIFRRYSLSVGAGYNTMSSIAQTLGKYTSEYATISLSRAFRRGISGLLSYSFQHYSIYDAPAANNEYRISTGVSWGNPNGRLWPF